MASERRLDSPVKWMSTADRARNSFRRFTNSGGGSHSKPNLARPIHQFRRPSRGGGWTRIQIPPAADIRSGLLLGSEHILAGPHGCPVFFRSYEPCAHAISRTDRNDPWRRNAVILYSSRVSRLPFEPGLYRHYA